MFSLLVIYAMAPYFFIILFFGDRSSRSYSFVIFTSCALNLLSDSSVGSGLALVERERMFIFQTNVSILWDSACALLLITTKLINQDSGKQALLLVFAVLCHIMVAYDIVDLFRTWYVELIIFIGILQMTVAWNGFRTAFIRLRESLVGVINYRSCSNSNLFERKEVKKGL